MDKQSVNRMVAELLYPDAEIQAVSPQGNVYLSNGIWINVEYNTDQLLSAVDALIKKQDVELFALCIEEEGIRQAMIDFVESCVQEGR